MQITINTAEPLSEKDRTLLVVLVGDGWVEGGSEPDSAEVKEEKPVAKPRGAAKKAAAAKKDAAKKPEPEPEEEPEPMAEEPIEEEPDEELADDEDEEQSDEDLLKLAVKKATEMVNEGDADKVREALDLAGANRVRELNKDNVREFFKALS